MGMFLVNRRRVLVGISRSPERKPVLRRGAVAERSSLGLQMARELLIRTCLQRGAGRFKDRAKPAKG
jgi:hypothetical protein